MATLRLQSSPPSYIYGPGKMRGRQVRCRKRLTACDTRSRERSEEIEEGGSGRGERVR